MSKTILILGGIHEANKLAEKLTEQHPDWRIIISLAGRTKEPKTTILETRIGGFGGAGGLAGYIKNNGVNKLIDCTHPFALNISKNAKLAAAMTNVEFEIINRPKWQKQERDIWLTVPDIETAANELPNNANALLALGRQYISAFKNRKDCQFFVRMVDKPDEPIAVPNAQLIIGKPSSDPNDEAALFKCLKLTHIVSRNSGGKGAYAKIIAARQLQIPVIMIDRSA